ncbi:MAG TPA: hypothetical protein VN679_15325 [Candidatus Acidoferrales bacterium]|nr:hypothetical protein [Candidatus Acidoferrales bacterium]
MKSNFKVYDSVHAFVGTRGNEQTIDRLALRTDEWTGPRNYKESKTYFLHGAGEDELSASRKLLNQIDVAVHGVQGEVWKPQVYGAYPVVADYLAGDPMCMRNKEWDETDVAPVRIILNTAVAAGVEADTIARRAAASAAFAMKLSERRPVELWISTALHNMRLKTDVGFRVKLDMPMNLSQVVAAYDRSVSRVLTSPILELLANNDDPNATESCDGYSFELNGFNANRGGRHMYMKAFRDYMNLSEDDIVLDAGILTDCEAIDRNPVEWVKSMLIKYGMPSED